MSTADVRRGDALEVLPTVFGFCAATITTTLPFPDDILHFASQFPPVRPAHGSVVAGRVSASQEADRYLLFALLRSGYQRTTIRHLSQSLFRGFDVPLHPNNGCA